MLLDSLSENRSETSITTIAVSSVEIKEILGAAVLAKDVIVLGSVRLPYASRSALNLGGDVGALATALSWSVWLSSTS